jgi:outer membrane murein-binding lipoprotein Lpp
VGFELASRVARLEEENERLRAKLDAAGTRVQHMLDRVRFLRQQAQGGGA